VYTTAHTWHQLGTVVRDQGDLDRATEYVERSLALFERLGDEHGRADCFATLGLIAGERGEFTIAAWQCRAARRLSHKLELAETEARAALGQAQARLRAGHVHGASVHLDHARDVATTCGLRLELTQVVLTRAELQLRAVGDVPDSLDTACNLADEALRLATERGYRREEALAHRLLGQCEQLRFDPPRADAHLRAALDLQQAMGATLESERTRLLRMDVHPAGSTRG
jgi:tetratricopeptide (TPR) repeat protein